jgi:hypothetical protein
MRLEIAPPLPPKCGAKRGPRSKTYCELWPGHEHDENPWAMHIGRSPSGKWFTWEVKPCTD